LKSDKFVFRPLDSIGYPDAQEDHEFLANCFVDEGYLAVLSDCAKPERVVIGRTGAGKSALLEMLLEEQGDRVKRFLPETLALNYVSDSPVFGVLKGLGVNLDLFFNLLWKHVFAVELIRWRFEITDSFAQQNIFQTLAATFNPAQRKALEYLRQFGDNFWADAENRVTALTKVFERELQGKLGLPDGLPVDASVAGKLKWTTEEKVELQQKAQSVVNDVQRRHLTEVTSLVKAVLADKNRKWYIIIDQLDENWVDDKFKAQLIRSLLDTIRSFQAVQNLKIIVALRYDLIDRVFRDARGSGAQREKYRGMYLDVLWKRSALLAMLDKRVDYMVKSRYTTKTVKPRDILPRVVDKKQPTIDWLLDRTLMRPRDVIAFINACIRNSAGSPAIPVNAIKAAEGAYSRDRLEAIYEEWGIEFPTLSAFTHLLSNKPSHFDAEDITEDELLEACTRRLSFQQGQIAAHDDLLSHAVKQCEVGGDLATFRRTLIWVFYKVGIVGIKVSASTRYLFSFDREQSISQEEILPTSRVAIQPTFWRVLATGRIDQLDPSRM
jgi:hypothetical protein